MIDETDDGLPTIIGICPVHSDVYVPLDQGGQSLYCALRQTADAMPCGLELCAYARLPQPTVPSPDALDRARARFGLVNPANASSRALDAWRRGDEGEAIKELAHGLASLARQVERRG